MVVVDYYYYDGLETRSRNHFEVLDSSCEVPVRKNRHRGVNYDGDGGCSRLLVPAWWYLLVVLQVQEFHWDRRAWDSPNTARKTSPMMIRRRRLDHPLLLGGS
jgi:hypothetical protein